MRELSPKGWIKTFFVMLIAVFTIFVGIVYFVDPLIYYRFSDGDKYLDPRFVSAGLIKNADYDTAIIGSSMTQNFDAAYFREKGWAKAVKLVPSGMTLNEGLLLFSNVMREDKAKKVVINVDWSTFTTDKPLDMSTEKLPDYLYNDSKLDDFKYLLGYESWTRFIPFNMAIAMDDKLRDSQKDKLFVDKVGYFGSEYTFSKEVIVEGYKSKRFPMTMYYQEGMVDIMKANIDDYVNQLMALRKDDTQIVFALPPYSALWWNIARWDQLYPSILEARRYFVESVYSYDNVRIVDMQSSDVIVDMNNYKDYTHFSPEIQTQYADAIMDGTRDIDLGNYLKGEQRLNELLDKFVAENITWLE